MINPTAEDIGRGVVYYGKHEDELLPAYGNVSGFDEQHVFVRYDDSEPMAALAEELIWTEPEMTQLAPLSEDCAVTDDQTLLLPL
jgi:hypothetical protein